MWKTVLAAILLFLVSSTLWNLYPRFFQARSEGYTLSAWGWFKKRATFTVIWTFVVVIVAAAALSQ